MFSLRDSIELQLLDLLRAYQLRNRYVGSPFGLPLTLAEGHVLVHVASVPNATARAVAESLMLHESTVARIIQKLIRSKFLTKVQSELDSRSKVISIAAQGQEMLRRYDAESNLRIEGFVRNLERREVQELALYLKLFADGEGAAEIVLRDTEHPMVHQIRRLTRAHGVLGRNYLGVSCSVTHWQILSMIAYSASAITAKELIDALALAQNTISASLGRLESAGLILRSTAAGDGRSKVIRLTPAGIKLLAQVESTAVARFNQSLKLIKEPLQARFVELFARYVGVSVLENGQIRSQNSLVRRLENSEDLHRARAFLVGNAVRRNEHFHLPSEICSENNICFIREDQGQISAVSEFACKDRRWKLINFEVSAQKSEPGVQELFLADSLVAAFPALRTKRIYVPQHSPAWPWALARGGADARDEVVFQEKDIRGSANSKF